MSSIVNIISYVICGLVDYTVDLLFGKKGDQKNIFQKVFTMVYFYTMELPVVALVTTLEISFLTAMVIAVEGFRPMARVSYMVVYSVALVVIAIKNIK